MTAWAQPARIVLRAQSMPGSLTVGQIVAAYGVAAFALLVLVGIDWLGIVP